MAPGFRPAHLERKRERRFRVCEEAPGFFPGSHDVASTSIPYVRRHQVFALAGPRTQTLPGVEFLCSSGTVGLLQVTCPSDARRTAFQAASAAAAAAVASAARSVMVASNVTTPPASRRMSTRRLSAAAAAPPRPPARQGLTLVPFSAQREPLSRDALGGVSGSGTKDVSS